MTAQTKRIPNVPLLYTEEEVAEATRLPVRTLQDWRYRPPKHGGIPWTKVGGRIRYREDVLHAWIERQTVDLHG